MLLLALAPHALPAQSGPTNLQVENRSEPLGIDVVSPRLSWNLSGAQLQHAYQVRAASTAALLDQDLPDLWDSGKIISAQANNIIYGGTPLQSRQRVYWQVRVWTDPTAAIATPWSAPASFEIGLLNIADWTAQWITHPTWAYGQPLPIFARQFTVPKPVTRARLYIAGIGAYSATLNGHPVTRDVLAPGNTDFARRIEYATYDAGSLLQDGVNAIGVELGNGDYNALLTPGHYMDFVNPASRPLELLVQLELTYSDGAAQSIVSDGNWSTTLGPTTVSTWYGGEEYDARREIAGWDTGMADLTAWDFAIPVTSPPTAQPVWRPAPPVRATAVVATQRITQPQPGIYVFDMGVNFAGWLRLRVSGPAGAKVSMLIGEQLLPDGTVDQSQIAHSPTEPDYPVADIYTLAGNGVETWHPKFAYHGFRYLQVTGLPSPPDDQTITGIILRADNPPAGSFTSSNDLLNSIHRITNRAIQSNMMSIFTDCPDREKLGWLADMQGIFPSIARNYDIAAYARNVVRNMADAQTSTGLVPDFVPEYVVYTEGFRDDPNWGGAMILTPWSLYQTYGDTRILADYYPNMQAYLSYLTSKSKGDLLDYGLNDWVTPDMTVPAAVIATYAYYRSASAMSQIATILGYPDDAAAYQALAQRITAAFNAAFLDPVSGVYAGGHQAADAVALETGMVPGNLRQAVLDHLIADIRARGNHMNVGIVTLGPLFHALSSAGRDDVVFDIATQTTSPSYGYQVAHGATALTEQWDGPTLGGSQNHMMLGAIDEWFTASLAGIRPAPGSVGYSALVIAPAIVGDLTHVAGSYRTPNGLVTSEWWKAADGGITLAVGIPPNTKASIQLPSIQLPTIQLPTADQARREVGPGKFLFNVPALQ